MFCYFSFRSWPHSFRPFRANLLYLFDSPTLFEAFFVCSVNGLTCEWSCSFLEFEHSFCFSFSPAHAVFVPSCSSVFLCFFRFFFPFVTFSWMFVVKGSCWLLEYLACSITQGRSWSFFSSPHLPSTVS